MLTLGVLLTSFAGVRSAGSRDLGPTPRALPAPRPALRIHLDPAAGDHRFRVETAAYVAARVERALLQLPGAFVEWDDLPEHPSLRALPPSERPRVFDQLYLSVRHGSDGQVHIDASQCPPEGACRSHAFEGPHEALDTRIGALVDRVASELGHPHARRPQAWAAPTSDDAYARLMLGRSAGTLAGLIEGPSSEHRNDVLKDPTARAVYVDRRMSLAWELSARSQVEPGPRAERLLEIPDPTPIEVADLAITRFASGSYGAAHTAWERFVMLQPDDDRFRFHRVAAAYAAGELRRGDELSTELDGDDLSSPRAVLLEVGMALRSGKANDGLLAEWQAAFPFDPTPVRLRIAHMLEARAHADALELAAELQRRGGREEAERLTLALASSLGHAELAAETARALGEDEVSQRLDWARRRPVDMPAALPGGSGVLRLRRAETALRDLDADRAHEELKPVLAAHPWWPEAHDTARRAWMMLGMRPRADAEADRVRQLDPLFYEGRDGVRASRRLRR